MKDGLIDEACGGLHGVPPLEWAAVDRCDISDHTQNVYITINGGCLYELFRL